MFNWLKRLCGVQIEVRDGASVSFPNVESVDTLNMSGGTVKLGSSVRMTGKYDGDTVRYGCTKTDTPPEPEVKRSRDFSMSTDRVYLGFNDNSTGGYISLHTKTKFPSLVNTLSPQDIPEAIRLLERARKELERG